MTNPNKDTPETPLNLKSLYQSFLGNPHSNWVMHPTNAEFIYEFIKKLPIKKVLDLGTGIGVSAAIAALALKEKGEGHVDTIEQYDKCIKLADKFIPKELKEYITVHKSGVEVWDNPDIPYEHFSIYSKLPETDHDLIIIDGPAFWLENEKLVDLNNGDNMKLLLEDKIKPGTLIMWDGRVKALSTLERYYSDNFSITQLAPKGEDYNVIKRLDNPLKFRDARLAVIKKTGYFDEDIVSTHKQGSQEQAANPVK